VNERPNIALSH